MGELLLNIYLWLLILGAMLMVWAMALIAHQKYVIREPWYFRQTRRLVLAAIALSFLWSAKYCVEHQWSPWTPDIVLVAGVDLYVLLAIISSLNKINNNRLK